MASDVVLKKPLPPVLSYDDEREGFVFVPPALDRIGDIPGESQRLGEAFEDPLFGFNPQAFEDPLFGKSPPPVFEDPLFGFLPQAVRPPRPLRCTSARARSAGRRR